MADDIEAACELSVGIAYAVANVPHWAIHYKADAEKLAQMLKEPAIGGKLSLVNPHPVTVCGLAWESYAAAVAGIVASASETSEPAFDSFTWMNCAKEYERATGRPCNAEEISKRQSRNPERDDWVIEQYKGGKTYKAIREEIDRLNAAKKPAEKWDILTSDQAVSAVLKRREVIN